MSEEVVLRVRDLTKHYPVSSGKLFRRKHGVVKAVDGINLTLHRGETIGLVGESGCGKSTLARMLLALEKQTSGTVTVMGQDINTLGRSDLHRMRRDIQIVMQDPYTSLNPRMTVGDLVGEPFEIHPDVVPRSKRRAAIQELLELVGLNPDHINRYPHQFSGGQRQRIGIARAFALRPKIVICDEPVSALDVSVQAQVINLLEDLQEELGLSYLFIAHDLAVVRHVSDRVNVMYLGKIVEEGDDQQIYEHPTHPYTQALQSAASEPDPGLQKRAARIVLTGEVPSPLNPPSGCSFRTRCWRAQDICTTTVPALTLRPQSDHLSACHFAEPIELSQVTVDEHAPAEESQ